MKVTVSKFLNVRVGKPSLNAPNFQYLAPGSELQVDGKLYKGDTYEGIDTWLKDEAGNYYWSGGVETNTEKIIDKPEFNLTDKKVKFQWFKSLGIESIWNDFNEKGDKVRIAVLDTGYNISNPDILEAIVDKNIIIQQKDYPNRILKIDDESSIGHGTRCASIIGGRNKFEWITGIAPSAELLVGKISRNLEVRNINYITDGIKWAINNNADIISISYAIELDEEAASLLNSKINEIIKDKQVLIFGASGNSDGSITNGERYPASLESCISVGAANKKNIGISNITIRSKKTIIHAPGEQIESYGIANSPTPMDGTSYATPIVAAIAGLAVSRLKKLNGSWNKTHLLDLIYESGTSIMGEDGKKIINAIDLFNKL